MATTLLVNGLTKRFGSTVAVDDLTATVRPGRVTGFLGPNGAGKTTTLQMLLGLVRPTSGTATFDGRAYEDLAAPTREVGTLLEATGFHPGRRARDHLRVLAAAADLHPRRVEEVLAQVGLVDAADRKTGGYSLGMRQRLGLAAALLGDPPVLVLDEPANGLDPQGIRWLRSFLRSLAEEGRTVLVSSHVLPEVEQTADDVLVLSKGRLVRSGTLAELRSAARGGTAVRTPDPARLRAALEAAGSSATDAGPDELHVPLAPERVGELAAQAGVVLHRLAPAAGGLEQVFLDLTADAAPSDGAAA